MKYEIRSRKTGKLIYEDSADDVAKDWNYKKRRLIMGRESDKRLKAHAEKFGAQDLILALPEKPKEVKKEVEQKQPVINKPAKKRGKRK